MLHLSDLGPTPISARNYQVSSTITRAQVAHITSWPPTSPGTLVPVPFEDPVRAFFLPAELPTTFPTNKRRSTARVTLHCVGWRVLSIRQCLTVPAPVLDRQSVQLFQVSRPAALLRCRPRFELLRRTLRSNVWHGVSVVHDAAKRSGVLLVSQKLC